SKYVIDEGEELGSSSTRRREDWPNLLRAEACLAVRSLLHWEVIVRKYRLAVTTAVASLLLLSGNAFSQENTRLNSISPVTDDMLLNPSDGDWLHWRRTYTGWGYSPLEQINKENVKNLGVAWTWSLTPGATETTPIVHDGVLYIHNNLDKVQALDGATGDLLWEYIRDLPQAVIDAGGNTATKRNMAIYQDKLIVSTSDTHIIALDAKTGQVVWDVQPADWSKGWRYSAGPLVA